MEDPPTTPSPARRPSPYDMIQRGVASAPMPELAAPRLPTEMRGPRLTLRRALPKCGSRKRTRIALALAQELAALHADDLAVGRLDPDAVAFGMTGYPEIASIGEPEPHSAYAAPELWDGRVASARPRGTPRADTYALGALIYFIYTGKEPPTTWTTRDFARLSPTAASVVARCVADDPWARPTAEEVAVLIERAGPERMRSDGMSHPIELIRRKPHGIWSAASVFALSATAAILVLAGTVTTALGAVGVVAMLVGASITVGAGV